MDISVNREETKTDVKKVVIYIGEDRYRISESIDGKLTINKTTDSNMELMRVYPRSGNEIEIN